MDLKHDWKIFNEILFPTECAGPTTPTMVIIEDQGKVIDGVVSSGTTFMDRGIVGLEKDKDRRDALSEKYSVEKTVFTPKSELDLLIPEVAGIGTNYFQQLQMVRTKILGYDDRTDGISRVFKRVKPVQITQDHFVLNLFGKTLQKLLPTRFNALVFIADRSVAGFNYRAILLSFNRGRLDQFYEPDFSSLHEERLMNWEKDFAAIGQYLESRYILPCYSLMMDKSVWNACLQAEQQKDASPWDVFVEAYGDGSVAVYPQGFISRGLILSQRLKSFFT